MNAAPRMHDQEVDVDEDLVRALLTEQMPLLASDPAYSTLRRVEALGTDHAIFRLGEDLSVRLPKIGWADGQGDRELTWLPDLAEHLPAEVPVPIALGRPSDNYPFRWSVVPWLTGERPDVADPDALEILAEDLATFVAALQACDPVGAPPPRAGRRGGPLAAADQMTRSAAHQLRGERDPATGEPLDVDALLLAWAAGVEAPQWTGPSVWIHGDLADGNLLVRHGRLIGVIDWSGLVAGDPAVELMCAWNMFDSTSRQMYRSALSTRGSGPDDATWLRGRAWAVSAALQALPYYRHTNPDIVERSWRTVRAALAES